MDNAIYCEICGIRPHKGYCDYCNLRICKICRKNNHQCNNDFANDMRQFAEEVKVRQHNMPDNPIEVMTDYLAKEKEIIDNHYITQNKALEAQVKALENEIAEMRTKFQQIEITYNAELKAISQSVSDAHESKMKEIVNIYESRESQYREHIAKLEESIKQQNESLQKPVQKKSTMGNAKRF